MTNTRNKRWQKQDKMPEIFIVENELPNAMCFGRDVEDPDRHQRRIQETRQLILMLTLILIGPNSIEFSADLNVFALRCLIKAIKRLEWLESPFHPMNLWKPLMNINLSDKELAQFMQHTAVPFAPREWGVWEEESKTIPLTEEELQ